MTAQLVEYNNHKPINYNRSKLNFGGPYIKAKLTFLNKRTIERLLDCFSLLLYLLRIHLTEIENVFQFWPSCTSQLSPNFQYAADAFWRAFPMPATVVLSQKETRHRGCSALTRAWIKMGMQCIHAFYCKPSGNPALLSLC